MAAVKNILQIDNCSNGPHFFVSLSKLSSLILLLTATRVSTEIDRKCLVAFSWPQCYVIHALPLMPCITWLGHWPQFAHPFKLLQQFAPFQHAAQYVVPGREYLRPSMKEGCQQSSNTAIVTIDATIRRQKCECGKLALKTQGNGNSGNRKHLLGEAIPARG
jgi:hypothetical protein